MRVRLLTFLVSCALLAACAGQQAPARRALAEIGATLGAVAGQAAAIVPDQYAIVQRQVDALQDSFGRKEYGAVVAAAPAVLAAVQGLQQNVEWSRVVNRVPGQFAAIESRIGALRGTAQRGTAANVDADMAEAALRAAMALWSKGQSAYAAGNLREALQAAQDVQTRTDAISASLRR